MLGENPQTIRKNTGILLETSKEIGLEGKLRKNESAFEKAKSSKFIKQLAMFVLWMKCPWTKRLDTILGLPIDLYGCETWTLTLREEQKLRIFENKVLRKIFGAKRDEVTGEWRTLHNVELHALYSSPDIIRNIKSRRMSESRNANRVLVLRPEEKRPLGGPKC
ncbi:hypothetical protein ANN_10098 [Periplaneta americana]|uniref:Uncharacterized protein n=1 Tax=Periplaneta americana TaxID=6978 RepID=A0ABQ8TPM3_PERAM|nr:hypothetical protein ANN_10098 [Periplaneta americana]